MILSGGSEPLLPPIDGLDGVEGVWTNREALTTKEIPPRMVAAGRWASSWHGRSRSWGARSR